MKRFTFKKHIPTGPYASFEADRTDIKLDKCVVGFISQYSRGSEYKVTLAVVKEKSVQSPSVFKWVKLKVTFPTETQARMYLNTSFEQLTTSLNIHKFSN